MDRGNHYSSDGNHFAAKVQEPLQQLPQDAPRTATSLGVQWLRLHAPNAGGQGFIPGQGT